MVVVVVTKTCHRLRQPALVVVSRDFPIARVEPLLAPWKQMRPRIAFTYKRGEKADILSL